MKINLDIACQNFLIPYIIRAWPKYKEAKHLMLIAKHLQAVEKGEIKRLIIAMPPRHGKQIADSEDVLTTKGWKKHGDLKIGDYVFGVNGNPIKVLSVTKPIKQNVEVFFTDGTMIKCHENHEWTVFDRSCGKTITLETKKLEERKVWIGPKNKRSGRATFQLPKIKSLEFNKADLPIDPYVFGVWLGDGRSSDGDFCWADKDKIIAETVNAIQPITSFWKHKTTLVNYGFMNGLKRKLKNLSVLNSKHIPDNYLLSSKEQRLKLLAGLIDTDGHVEIKTQRVRIATANRKLAEGIKDLIRSLGWRANEYIQKATTSTSGIVGKKDIVYVSFTPDSEIPTVVPRKKITGNKNPKRRIGISEIKRGEEVIGRCIQVDSKDGLYLVGKSLIPTHNSLTLSEYFPAWYMGRNPTHQVIFSTYGQKLASGFGRKVRNQMNDPLFRHLFPKCRISPDSKSKNEFTTTEGGVYIAVGRGGSLTGKGANLAILDDLIKDQEEAQSEAVREGLKDWYEATLSTRMQPNGAIIINATRWHEDDLTGWVQKRFKKEGWVKLILPALDENDNALWPEMWPAEELKKIRDSKSPYWWSALYQQSPTPKGGNIFKKQWFNFYDILPQDAKIHLQSWDLSFKAGPDNSFVVGQVWAKRGAQKYLVHQFRKQIGFNDTEKEIIRMTLNFPLAKRKLIEDKANGPAIMNSLGRKISGLIPVDPKGASKESRWLAAAEIIESGNVFIPNPVNNPWVEEYLNEMTMVPNSAFNDQADATAQAILDMEDENLNALDSFLNM